MNPSTKVVMRVLQYERHVKLIFCLSSNSYERCVLHTSKNIHVHVKKSYILVNLKNFNKFLLIGVTSDCYINR